MSIYEPQILNGILFLFSADNKSFGDDPYTSYDSLDKYNYALETLKLTDTNTIRLDDGQPPSHALAALNQCMLQPKCRQPVYVHNENGRRVDPTNIGLDIEITPQLPPRPPLPRSPSSVSTKDMEKQQQLSDWYYIKSNSKSPLPPPRPDKRNGLNGIVRAAADQTVKQTKADGIYAKNPKVVQRDPNKNNNQTTVYYPCTKRDDNCNFPFRNGSNKSDASSVDNRNPDDIRCKYNAKSIRNNHTNERTEQAQLHSQHGQQVNGLIAVQYNSIQLTQLQFHERQQLQRNDNGTLTPPQPMSAATKHPIVPVKVQQELYEELIHPSLRLPLSPRYGELSSSSFEHVNVSNYLASSTSTTDVATTIADKRFNKSTGNFTDEQQMAAANGTEQLQRKAVGVSQPIQRRRPPPPPIPSSTGTPLAAASATVAVPSANTQNVSRHGKKTAVTHLLHRQEKNFHSNDSQKYAHKVGMPASSDFWRALIFRFESTMKIQHKLRDTKKKKSEFCATYSGGDCVAWRR